MSLLSVHDFSLNFRTESGEMPVVRKVSFELEAGEMLALVGESGSGKSVTALSILQLLPAVNSRQSGSIRLEEQELLGAPEKILRTLRGNRIAMIFQEPMTSLNPLHSIGRQIAESLRLHKGLTGEKATAEVKRRLSEVGLEKLHTRLNAYPHQLSGGERQRVMIAMALACDPELLIADEPTTAIDVTLQVQILALLKKLQTERGLAILLITHDLPLVRRLANRVAVMQHGQIVEQGAVETVFATPAHPYTRHLLASEPKGSAAPLAAAPHVLLEAGPLTVSFARAAGFFKKKFLRAVDEVSIILHEGETLGIVGESGSGKTTLALALLRLAPSEGPILFLRSKHASSDNGKNASTEIHREDFLPLHTLSSNQLRPLRRTMQLVFQDPFGSLNPRLTVEEIIGEGLAVHFPELSAETRHVRIAEALVEVGLTPDMAERYPHAFSGGQRQRIAIARAMVLRPRLVVLDEPTSALDLSVQSQILDLLKQLQRERGLSYLFISHDLRCVRAISHRIAVMKEGRIVETGETEALFQNPQQDYTKRLIDAAFLETIPSA